MSKKKKSEKIQFLAQRNITQLEKSQIFRVLLLIVLSRLGADHIFNLKFVPIVSLTKDYIISNTRRQQTAKQQMITQTSATTSDFFIVNLCS